MCIRDRRSCTLCCPMGHNFGISVHPHARSVVLPHQTDVNGQQDSKCSLPALEARPRGQSHQVERGGSRWSCSRSGMLKRTRIQQRAELKPLNHRELHMSAGRCSMWLRYVPSCERTTRNAALKQQLAGKREILLLTRQQFVEAYQQSRSRERGIKFHC